MESVPKDQWDKISFPDCEIRLFRMSPSTLEIRVDGVYIDTLGMVNAPVHMLISNWKQASSERFDCNGANPTGMNLNQCGELREICEWVFTESELSFAGFERKSGLWQRFNFQNADIEIRIQTGSKSRSILHKATTSPSFPF